MFNWGSQRRFGHDLFNRLGERNSENTDQVVYNCGGFALGTFSWYLPQCESAWGCWEDDWSMEEMTELTDDCVAVMLDEFPDLREIQYLSEVRHDEYAIAFRLSSDGDFHYVRQMHGRTWTHKCGGGEIQTMTRWEVFNTDWCWRYNGPIVLLAKKRG